MMISIRRLTIRFLREGIIIFDLLPQRALG